jgi:hypothetical protein
LRTAQHFDVVDIDHAQVGRTRTVRTGIHRRVVVQERDRGLLQALARTGRHTANRDVRLLGRPWCRVKQTRGIVDDVLELGRAAVSEIDTGLGNDARGDVHETLLALGGRHHNVLERRDSSADLGR